MYAEKDFGVETKWIVADFTQGREIYQHIEKELKDLPIGIFGIFNFRLANFITNFSTFQ